MSVPADFDATGVWQGTATLGTDAVAVTATLAEQDGALTGVLFLGDPSAGQLVGAGKVTGARAGDTATWQNGAGAAVSGTFDPDSFAGTLSLTRPDSTVVGANLSLQRAPTRRQGFVPIAPYRLADTREIFSEPLDADTVHWVPVSGLGGMPFDGVAAVVVNITGTEARGPGYVTAWASGTPRPGTANLNLEFEGQTAGNLAVVPVGEDGYIQLYTQTGAHLVVDAFGWFSASSILSTASAPTRVLDTRSVSPVGYSGPKPAAGTSILVSLAGMGGMPASGIQAAIVNIVATEATAPGYITAWAEGRPQPFTANLNVDAAGQTIGNLAIVPVDEASRFRLFTQSGTHLVADLFGWFTTEPVYTGPSWITGGDGNLVADGSFEASTTIEEQPVFRSVGDDVIGAWMVVENGVDLVGPDQAVAADGQQFVDLNGNGFGPGAIQQLLATSPERQYEVSFMLSGNTNGEPVVKDVEVVFGDARHRYSFDTTGRSNEDLGWTTHRFVANPDCGSSTTLTFRSLTPGERGPNIDAVRVVDAGPGTGCNIGGYRSIDPHRLLDTRPGSAVGHSGAQPGPGGEVRVQVAGVGGIAPSGVSAVAVNIVATEAVAPGYITAWASGTQRPTTSSLNLSYAGQTRGNHAIVPVGADGAISLFTQSGAHLVVDAFGWFS